MFIPRSWLFFIILSSCCLRSLPARCQGESDYWYYSQAGLHFTSAGVQAIPGAPLDSEEGSATIADAAGNLLFYTDGSTIWTRQHQPMPNGAGLEKPYQYSSTQGALIVQDPGDAARYYVFLQAAYGYPDGLSYVIVDMRLNAGYGAVIAPPIMISPPGIRLAEKLAGVLHTNGRDTWILTHGIVGSTVYYAYLLSPSGVSAPVATSVGQPHGRVNDHAGYLGYLRASPNGQKLGSAVGHYGLVELLDFDATTGRPSNAVLLADYFDAYGVEFSADGATLYATEPNNNLLHQFDLLAGAGPAVAASDVVVGRLSSPQGLTGALQRGRDGRIYVAQRDAFLGVVAQPSVRGLGCGYQEKAIQARATYGLPNFPNQFAAPGRTFVHLTAQVGCAGTLATFAARFAPTTAPAGSSYTWTFGDPGAGTDNTSHALAPTHRYPNGGNYLVSLQVLGPDGQLVASSTTLVTVLPPPKLTLLPRSALLCPGDSIMLTATSGAGVTYRWPDGTTGSQYLIRRPGTYRVMATSPQGCTSQDSVVVTGAPAPVVTLGPDTSVCAVQPTVLLLPSAQLAGATYRWQDGSTGTTLTAPGPGAYWVEVRSAQGCKARARIQVTLRECPVVIPNIVTPNADGHNDYWVLQGLNAPDWALEIYDRWGVKHYSVDRYDNRWQGSGLTDGVYYYLLQHRSTQQRLRGWVEVTR